MSPWTLRYHTEVFQRCDEKKNDDDFKRKTFSWDKRSKTNVNLKVTLNAYGADNTRYTVACTGIIMREGCRTLRESGVEAMVGGCCVDSA